jgi:hypothetical protein
MKSYPKVTFDKEIGFKTSDAEFVSFGHPLFEAVLEWVEREISPDLQKGAVFIDPEGKLSGYIMFFEGEIKDGTGSVAGKSLFAYFYDPDSEEVKSISPTIMWDIAEGESKGQKGVDIEELKKKVLSKVINGISNYMSKLQSERLRQTEIKMKYGVRSLDELTLRLDGELIGLYERKNNGENVDLAIRNKEEQKRRYDTCKKELEDLIKKEKNLTMSMPTFVGIVRVLPKAGLEEGMFRDEEIEMLGMEVAMRFERDAEREPEDVSKENLGFDIRSKDKVGKLRYIEVKSRAQIGAIALTQNEWFKAQRLADDYYLYVIWNARKDPNTKPLIIQNPATNLLVDQKVEIVRYIVPAIEIEKKAI